MGARDSAIIDLTEAVYDLGDSHAAWLAQLLRAGAPVLDHGLGVLALTCVRPLVSGPLEIESLHTMSGPHDFDERVTGLQQDIDMELLWPLSRPGVPKTLSEVTHDHNPAAFQAIMRHFNFAQDALGLSAFEPGGHGVYLIVALPKVTSLSDRARERWQMLAAHFRAGYRLRHALEEHARTSLPDTGLPLHAEVVIDPTDFSVADAAGQARSRPALAALRRAAERVDRSRGELRESDPDQALELWKALVRGRWSTVDWFDSDGRRYVLGIPNAPDVLDPRGLTEREMQVVSFAAAGMTNKMIGYNLGVSKGRVSALLRSAMKKLGIHTRAQLVKRLKDFGSITGS